MVMRQGTLWYQADANDPCLDPAREAFDEAIQIFSASWTKDPKKKQIAENFTSLSDLQGEVAAAKASYETARKGEKVRRRLSKFSSSVQYYGNIIDVLVQHHPEYVSLVWGTMKILFVSVVNHEAMLSSLCKELSQIADALPRVKLTIELYPTKEIKLAVAKLYASIIKFFIRATDWYSEGKWSHALHSLTRPVELRNKDLVDEIWMYSREIERLAATGAKAEQRDMHLEQQDIHLELRELGLRQSNTDALLHEVRDMLIAQHAINSSALINTNYRLHDLQFGQIMGYLSATPILDPVKTIFDPMKTFQHCLLMRNYRRKAYSIDSRIAPFWLSPKMRDWAAASMSSLIMIKGTFKARFELKDFCIDIIELVKEVKIPVLWVMKMSDQEMNTNQEPSEMDLLKHLTSQALSLTAKSQTEQSIALSFARFHCAATEDEWFALLGSIVGSFSHICLVIDVETLSSCFQDIKTGFSWPRAFVRLFERLSDRGLKTVVKVVMVSYGSMVFLENPDQTIRNLVIPVKPIPKKLASPRSKALGRRGTTRGGPRQGGTHKLAFHSP